MRYLRVIWKHDFAEEPVVIYSELSDDNREIRKIEKFRDGSVSYACAGRSTGSTQLSETRLPSIKEIADDPQFEPTEIDQAKFEDLWRRVSNAR